MPSHASNDTASITTLQEYVRYSISYLSQIVSGMGSEYSKVKPLIGWTILTAQTAVIRDRMRAKVSAILVAITHWAKRKNKGCKD